MTVDFTEQTAALAVVTKQVLGENGRKQGAEPVSPHILMENQHFHPLNICPKRPENPGLLKLHFCVTPSTQLTPRPQR